MVYKKIDNYTYCNTCINNINYLMAVLPQENYKLPIKKMFHNVLDTSYGYVLKYSYYTYDNSYNEKFYLREANESYLTIICSYYIWILSFFMDEYITFYANNIDGKFNKYIKQNMQNSDLFNQYIQWRDTYLCRTKYMLFIKSCIVLLFIANIPYLTMFMYIILVPYYIYLTCYNTKLSEYYKLTDFLLKLEKKSD